MSEYLRPIDLNGAAAAGSSVHPPSKLVSGPPSSAVLENPKDRPDTNQNYACDLLPSARMKWSIPGITKDLHVPDRYAVIQKSFSNPPALTSENRSHMIRKGTSMLHAKDEDDDDKEEEESHFYGKTVDDFLDQKRIQTKKLQNKQKQASEKDYRSSSAPKAIMHDDDVAEVPSLLSNPYNNTGASNNAGGIDMQSLGITGKVMTPEVRKFYDKQQGRVTGVLATPQVVTHHNNTTNSSNHLTRTVKTRNTAPASKTNPTNASTSLIETIGEESPAAAGFDFTNSFSDGTIEQPRQTSSSNSSSSIQMSSTLPQKLRGLFVTKTTNPTWKAKNIIFDSQYNVKDVISENDDDESITERTSNADTAFRRIPSKTTIPASTRKPKKNMYLLESNTKKSNEFQNQASPTGTTADLRQILKQCIQENFSNVETLDEAFQNELVQAFTTAVREVKRSRSRVPRPKPVSKDTMSSLIVSVIVLILTLARLWYLYFHYSPPVIPEAQTPSHPVQVWIASMSKSLLAAKQNNFESDLDYRLAVIQFEAGV
jgi:hypothetical protein